MGLVERLEGSFTDLLGGSLSGSFASFDEALSKEPGVAPPIDPAQIGALTASFTAQAPDFGSIASLAAERVSSAAAVVPGAQDLLRPLMSGIELAERAMSERDFVSRIGGLTRGRREASGIDSIAGVFDGLSSARNDSGIGLVFELLPAILPMPLDLDRAQSEVSTTGGALMDLMRALRGPMAIATALEDLDRTASIVGDLLNVRAFQTARVRLDAAVPGLVDFVRSIDPNDAVMVDAAERAMRNLRSALDDVDRTIVGGMAFAEATLVDFPAQRKIADLHEAREMTRSAQYHRIRAGAESLRERIMPVLDRVPPLDAVPLADPLLAEVERVAGRLADAVAAIDTSSMTRLVAEPLGRASGAIDTVSQAVREATVAVQAALGSIRDAVRAIDLSAISSAVSAFLEPIRSAVAAIEAAVGEALEAIRAALNAIVALVREIEEEAGPIADAIKSAYDELERQVKDLDLEEVIEALRSGIAEAVAALERIQLRPYFDTAADVMNTGAELLGAVPLDLLPDDMLAELDAVTDPIQAIDFERDVAQVLAAELRQIRASLDTAVLDELDRAYRDVVTFFASIDPRAEIERVEREGFDPLLDRLRAVDPTEILAPLESALDEVRGWASQLDAVGAIVAPVEQAFDQILAGYDQLDPAALVAPLDERIDRLRTDVLELTGLERWGAAVDGAAAAFDGFLDTIDIAAISQLIGSALPGLEPPPSSGSGLLGLLLSVLFSDRPALRATDHLGAEEATAMIEQIQAKLAAAKEAAAFDLAELAASVQPVHRGLAEVIAANPGTELATRLEPLLGPAPLDRFAALEPQRAQMIARLDDLSASLDPLRGAGFSELAQASASLREALAPIAVLGDRASALARLLDVDPSATSILRGLLAAFPPERLLQILRPALEAIREKVRELVAGILHPVRDAIAAALAFVQAFDLSFLVDELNAIHAEIRAEISSFRPSVLLAGVLAAIDDVQQMIESFDPLAGVSDTIVIVRDAIGRLADRFRPSVIFSGAIGTYEHVVELASGLDVRTHLDPVLAALDDIGLQLEEGLVDTGRALDRLKEAIP